MKYTIIAIVSVLAIVVLVSGCALVGEYNSLVAAETGVKAVWRDSAVQYDAFWKKVKETAQVPDRYKDAFKETLLAATEARYKDKDPAFLFITEANPTLDPTMYVKVQQVIESGRNDFALTQRTLVDRQRAYELKLSTVTGMLVGRTLGFPKEVSGEYAPEKDLDGDGRKTVLDYPTVTSTVTKEAFRSGEAEQLDVFGK